MSTGYQIEFKKSAVKEFRALPRNMQGKILEAFALLKINPRTELLPIKMLKGVERYYRLRIGDYRIVYEIRDDRLVIIVIKVGNRRDVYRNLGH